MQAIYFFQLIYYFHFVGKLQNEFSVTDNNNNTNYKSNNKDDNNNNNDDDDVFIFRGLPIKYMPILYLTYGPFKHKTLKK